jgi:hypothetical protein
MSFAPDFVLNALREKAYSNALSAPIPQWKNPAKDSELNCE